jgi:SAM-dependent methyltransferase
MYKDFEERVRTMTPQALRTSQRFFVELFRRTGVRKVLDLGIGKGVFLDLLRESNCQGVGIELDEALAREAREKGHEVIVGDVIDVLGQDIGSFDGVFASHLIEHFAPKDAFKLLTLIRNRLTEQGVLIIVTPNSRSIIQHLKYFYCDYTHVRFYPPELLRFFLEQVGFSNIEVGFRPDSALFRPEKLGLTEGKILPVSKKGISPPPTRSELLTIPLLKRPFILIGKKARYSLQKILGINRLNEAIDQLNKSIWVSNFVLGNMLEPGDIYIIGKK